VGFKDLEDFLDPTLVLPIRGKKYVVPSPPADLGLRVQRLVALGNAAANGLDLSPEDLASIDLDDDEERDLLPRLLGSAYGEMVADGLPWEWVKHAGTTALMWVGLGYEAAEAFWSSAVGEARRPVPQDHKAPAPKTAQKAAKKTAAPKGGARKRTTPASSTTPTTSPPQGSPDGSMTPAESPADN